LPIKSYISKESPSRSGCEYTEKKGWNADPKKNRFGFTLIEVMVCVCIIGVLAGIATPLYVGYRERARVVVAISDMKTIETAIFNFFATGGSLPDTLAQIGMNDLRDPWGNPYAYLRINGVEFKGVGGQRKDHFMVPVNTDFDLYSMGRDGASQSPFTAKASRDDIVRAYNGGFYGKVSEI
jgi:general secretion pathway protein G